MVCYHFLYIKFFRPLYFVTISIQLHDRICETRWLRQPYVAISIGTVQSIELFLEKANGCCLISSSPQTIEVIENYYYRFLGFLRDSRTRRRTPHLILIFDLFVTPITLIPSHQPSQKPLIPASNDSHTSVSKPTFYMAHKSFFRHFQVLPDLLTTIRQLLWNTSLVLFPLNSFRMLVATEWTPQKIKVQDPNTCDVIREGLKWLKKSTHFTFKRSILVV